MSVRRHGYLKLSISYFYLEQ